MNDHLAMHLLNRMPQKVKRIAEALLHKTPRRCPPWILSRIFLFVASLERKGAKYFGRSFTAKSSCTGCGLCAKLCPQENITIQNNRPAFGENCILCLRCIYTCPARAITPGKMSLPLCKTYNLKALIKKMEGITLDPVEKCAKGISLSGVRNYLDKEDI